MIPVVFSVCGAVILMVLEIFDLGGKSGVRTHAAFPMMIAFVVATGVFDYPTALPMRYPLARRRFAQIRWGCTLFNLASFVAIFCAIEIPLWMVLSPGTHLIGLQEAPWCYFLLLPVSICFWGKAVSALLEMWPKMRNPSSGILIAVMVPASILVNRTNWIQLGIWVHSPWLFLSLWAPVTALGLAAYRGALAIRYKRADLPVSFGIGGVRRADLNREE
jgi:hypothetical protein